MSFCILHLSSVFLLHTSRLFFWGIHGVFVEVMFTGIWEFVMSANWKLRGVTSMWCFLIYGVGGIIAEQIFLWLISLRAPWFLRGLVYVLVTFAWELTWGVILNYFGARGWDYSQFGYNFLGSITLEYTPLWYFGGFYFELLYGVISQLEEIPAWKLRAKKNS